MGTCCFATAMISRVLEEQIKLVWSGKGTQTGWIMQASHLRSCSLRKEKGLTVQESITPHSQSSYVGLYSKWFYGWLCRQNSLLFCGRSWGCYYLSVLYSCQGALRWLRELLLQFRSLSVTKHTRRCRFFYTQGTANTLLHFFVNSTFDVVTDTIICMLPRL